MLFLMLLLICWLGSREHEKYTQGVFVFSFFDTCVHSSHLLVHKCVYSVNYTYVVRIRNNVYIPLCGEWRGNNIINRLKSDSYSAIRLTSTLPANNNVFGTTMLCSESILVRSFIIIEKNDSDKIYPCFTPVSWLNHSDSRSPSGNFIADNTI